MRIHHLLLLVTLVIVSCKNSTAQSSKESDISEGNTLFFSKADFSKKKAAEPVFSDSFTLNEDPYLSIKFTLEEPLIRILEAVAPCLI